MPARPTPSVNPPDVWGAALNAHLNVALDQATGNLKPEAVQAALGGSMSAINVKQAPYNAVGDGSTDDTTAIQNAITLAVAVGGGIVYLPQGTYKLTAALTVAGSVRICGAGVEDVRGDVSAQAKAIDYPTASPYLGGSVLLQTAAATDCIQVTGSSDSVHLSNFGIRFADAIKFNNTGHGVYVWPDLVSGSNRKIGLASGLWENLAVFGHDGNHYAYYLRNPICSTFNHLRSYGGGAVFVGGNSGQNYGNVVFEHLYGQVIAGGSAHGIELNGLGTNVVNLVLFDRPQVSVQQPIAALGVSVNPTNAQKHVSDTGATKSRNIVFVAADFETDATGSSPAYPNGTGCVLIGPMDSLGSNSRLPNLAVSRLFGGVNNSDDTKYLSAITAGAALGTSPPGVATTPSDYPQDVRGHFTFGTGTTPSAGTLFTCSFASGYANFAPTMVVSAMNSATQALGLYIKATTSGFTIGCTTAPAASQANTTYELSYMTIG